MDSKNALKELIMTTLPIIKNIETELVHVNANISNTPKETTVDPLSKFMLNNSSSKRKGHKYIPRMGQISNKKQENNSNFHN